mmetsp:Transcript_25713/g.57660  ORF Transcript_25713/g.57660 Transcript_25713/m.57660 type:complete len:282 (+) Transcript_25713:129-974(+)
MWSDRPWMRAALLCLVTAPSARGFHAPPRGSTSLARHRATKAARPLKRRPLTSRMAPMSMGLFDYVNPLYWKREYITAAMLSRQIPSSAQTVLELFSEDGKRFYYYPKTVSQVIVVPGAGGLDDKTRREMDEMAAKAFKALRVADLSSLPSGAVDVVVSVNKLGGSPASTARDLFRVLRPGGRLVFVEPLKDLGALDGTAFSVTFDEEDGFAVGIGLKDASPKGPELEKGQKKEPLGRPPLGGPVPVYQKLADDEEKGGGPKPNREERRKEKKLKARKGKK